MSIKHEFLKMISVDATELFNGFCEEDGEENTNWLYCNAFASFIHRDACEFLIYLADDNFFSNGMLGNMKLEGCTEEFITTVIWARGQGATWLLLHA